MAYVLEAIVVAKRAARACVAACPGVRLVRLNDEFALVPISGPLHGLSPDDQPLLLSSGVPPALERLLAEVSRAGPVSYLEAEFFGGTGQQAAAVWLEGELAWLVVDPEEAAEPTGTINRALRALGVRTAEGTQDEFDTVGLGRHRSMEDWLEAADPD